MRVVIILLVTILFFQVTLWATNKLYFHRFYSVHGGFVASFQNLIVGFFVPELITLYIICYLTDLYHRIFKIDRLRITLINILGYEFAFLPLFSFAFFLFFPITLNVRYLLREFPNYSFEVYQYKYWSLIANDYLDTYWLYLPFIVLLGYSLLNVSLTVDFFDNIKARITNIDLPGTVKKSKDEVGKKTNTTPLINDEMGRMIQLVSTDGTKVYIDDFSDCYYFEPIEPRGCCVTTSKGQFRVMNTLSEIEAIVGANSFFRLSRSLLINLNCVQGYTHTDYGRYVLNTTFEHKETIWVPRTRSRELKNALNLFLKNT